MTIPSPRKLNPLTRRQRSAAFVLVAGLGFLWMMWRSGGDYWPAQRPFMLVTLICAAIFIMLIMLAVLAPRGAAKRLLSGGAFLAALPMFLGEGLAERGRFEDMRASLAHELSVVAQGGACTIPCRIEQRSPLRVAFLLSGEGAHWSGACYDATGVIYGIEYGGRVRPPDATQAPILAEASKMFSGQVRHAPEWGDHWFGCSTRP